jgi:hypothetical protein
MFWFSILFDTLHSNVKARMLWLTYMVFLVKFLAKFWWIPKRLAVLDIINLLVFCYLIYAWYNAPKQESLIVWFFKYNRSKMTRLAIFDTSEPLWLRTLTYRENSESTIVFRRSKSLKIGMSNLREITIYLTLSSCVIHYKYFTFLFVKATYNYDFPPTGILSKNLKTLISSMKSRYFTT